ncbi:copper homeostasis protein CutC [Pilibacter termitis]|uniref:copper homeostasis protein CutC n=1 Tax=Pilibacter termitis TaxID=263852 RepID=UPI000999A7E9|nr:copper homeostasis protein CutC [Pilibacter termitis]
MLKEFCAENFTRIPQAIRAGAKRIELCDNLAVGGTTPSIAVIEESVKYAHEKNVSVFVMIRPRGGNFVYNDIEIKMMEIDILEAMKREVDGVVFGLLTPDNWIDTEALETLMLAANGVEVTFHMAFDEIPKERQKEAIDVLADLGVSRILTHGSALASEINENYEHLREIVDYAKGKLHILIGGGVRFDNFEEVVDKTGTREVHGTKIVAMQ